MKRVISLCLIFVLLLMGGCANQTADVLLCYPGLEWGMTCDQVIAKLNLAESSYTRHFDITDTLYIDNFEAFEATADKVIFNFKPDRVGLSSIMIIYPDFADMDAVKAQIEEQYGSPVDKYIEYHPGLSKIEKFKDQLQYTEYLSDTNCVYWVSDVTMSGYLEKKLIPEYIASLSESVNPSIYEEYLDMASVTYIKWTNNYESDTIDSRNVVFLNSECGRLDRFMNSRS